MGKTPKNILVIIIIFNICLAKANVEAKHYDAFWLWSGVKVQPVLNKAHTLYLLQGQIDINHKGQTYFVKQGNGLIRKQPKQLWLTYRVHTLAWTEETYTILLKQLEQWQLAGMNVTGVQIDFDVPTRQLETYVNFLKEFKKKLPTQYQLSITGLLDWGVHADPLALNQLANIVNEVVLQTYQDRYTIPNYQVYLLQLKKLKLPFKIGLVQYGEWQEPSYLKENPYFLGYVVFLQNK